jgi:hypothetical protein
MRQTYTLISSLPFISIAQNGKETLAAPLEGTP